MRILYVTTIAITMNFFPEHIRMLQEEGHQVELATNLNDPLPERVAALNCRTHHIPFSRSPLSRDNLRAYQAFKNLLDTERYDIVHTHTPNASAIVRLACRKLRKKGTRVFYTAHGFHFYTGAPMKNWLIYYPVERFLSRWTDVLITISQEDLKRAKTFHAKKVAFVHGVGLDTARFDLQWTAEEKWAKRQELGVGADDVMLLSVGELRQLKNHEIVIRALAKLKNPRLRYVICGEGPLREHLSELARELDVADQVSLLGIRRDIAQLNQVADMLLMPSFREGLPVALMEAMAARNPQICSADRGSVDLIVDGQGGAVCPATGMDDFAKAIAKLAADKLARERMGEYNRARVEAFQVDRVLDELREIYGLNGARGESGEEEAVPVGAATW